MGAALRRRATYSWTQLTGAAPWHVRDGAHLHYLGGKLRLYGGWYGALVPEWNNHITTNEMWSSDDDGATWTQDAAHDDAPPTTGPGARWTRRHTAGWTVAGNYLYVIGGDFDNVISDTWRTSLDDGLTWERRSASAGWGGRFLHMTGSLAGNLYVMGGQTSLASRAFALKDVWRSTDQGTTWTQLADAPWAARGMVYELAEYKGYLWLVGGGTYGPTGSPVDRDYYNDVWKFDGTTWTQVLANGHTQWPGREYHNLIVYAGRMWISGGFANGNRNDVYSSTDGEQWTQQASTPWAIEHAAGLAVTPRGLVHATGNAMDQSVYRLAP